MPALSPEEVDITNNSEQQPLSPPPFFSDSSSLDGNPLTPVSNTSDESSDDAGPEVAHSANNVRLEQERNARAKEETAKTIKARPQKKVRVLPDGKFEEPVDEETIIKSISAGETRPCHPDALNYVLDMAFQGFLNIFSGTDYASMVLLVGCHGFNHAIGIHKGVLCRRSTFMTEHFDSSPDCLSVQLPNFSEIVIKFVVELLYTGEVKCTTEDYVEQIWDCLTLLGVDYEKEQFSRQPAFYFPTYLELTNGESTSAQYITLSTYEDGASQISKESEAHSNTNKSQTPESETKPNENLKEIPVPESEILSVNKTSAETHVLESQMPSGNDTSQEISVPESELLSQNKTGEDISGLETASIPDTTRANATDDEIIEQKPAIDESDVTFLYAKIVHRPTPLRRFNPNSDDGYMPTKRAVLLKRLPHKRKLEERQDSSNRNGEEKKKCESNDDIVLDSNPTIIGNDAFKKMVAAGKLSLQKLMMNTTKPDNPVESQTDENLQTKEKESSRRMSLKREKVRKATTIAGANNSPEQMPELRRELSPISDTNEDDNEIPRLNSVYDETYGRVPRKVPVSPDITAAPFTFPQLPEATKVQEHNDNGKSLRIANQRLNDHDDDGDPQPSTSAALRASLATSNRCESSPETDQPPSEPDGQNNLQDKEFQVVIGSRKMGIPNDETVDSYIEDYPTNNEAKTKKALSKIVSKFFNSKGTQSTSQFPRNETEQPLTQENDETNGSMAVNTAAPESSPAFRVRPNRRGTRGRDRGRSVNASQPGPRVLRSRPATEHDINNVREQEQLTQEIPDSFQRDE